MRAILFVLFAVLLGAPAQAGENAAACGSALAEFLKLSAEEPINLKGSFADCDATITLLPTRSSIGDQAVLVSFSGMEGATVSSEAEITPAAYQEGSCEVVEGRFKSTLTVHVRQGWLGQHNQRLIVDVKDGKITAIDSQYYWGGAFSDSHTFVRKCKY